MKKFEEFNRKYAHLARSDEDESHELQIRSQEIKCWMHKVESWIQQDVQFAVYESLDHEEWQKFRCSLKGQSTKMKLVRLGDYLMDNINRDDVGEVYRKIIMCRVDNYIGALVRGGQLDSQHRIIK